MGWLGKRGGVSEWMGGEGRMGSWRQVKPFIRRQATVLCL